MRAVAALLAGDRSGAARELERLAARSSASAAVWNDLAVVRLDAAHGDVLALCRALAAADHALDLDPVHPEALHNRALILDALSLRRHAVGAYGDLLRAEPRGAWSAEARRRLSQLDGQATRERAWEDRLRELLRGGGNPDDRLIRSAAARFPQEARVWTETELLGSWGEAALRGGGSATTTLALARGLGKALRDIGEDELPADAVGAVDGATSRGSRTRVLQLARAHVSYRDARILYRERKVAVAVPLLREASRLFARADSPMRLVADYYLANASIDMGDRAAATAIARELRRELPSRYRALGAELSWLEGVLAGLDGSLEEALKAFERAAATFDGLGEKQLATDMRDRIAAVLTMLGRTNQAWELRRSSFPVAGESDNPRRIETTLYSAVTDAVHERQWDVAHALLALVAGVEGGNVRLHAEALVWRALAAERAGMERTAALALAEARRASLLVTDPDLRGDVENELRLVTALLVRAKDPTRSVELLNTYLTNATRRGQTARLAQVMTERARSWRRVGRPADAESDYRGAIELVEARRAAISRPDLRDSFLGTSNAPYAELSDLVDRRGDSAGAILIADRRRARLLLDRIELVRQAPHASLDRDFSHRIPAGVAALTYGMFRDRLVVFVCTRAGIRRTAVRVPASEVASAASAFVAALARRNAIEARRHGSTLYKLLIAPGQAGFSTADKLVIVADEPLQRIPFAALAAVDGPFLVEQYTIAISPSIHHYLAAQHAGPEPPRALVVGNPRLADERRSAFAPLPGAEDEARQIADIYGSPTVLLGERATKANVVREMAASEIVHIASHAIVDQVDPRRSRLLLAAGANDDGDLSADEIAAMSLGHLRCVVLAACRTAVTTEGYGDMRSLSAAFLAAGAHEVVATLWDVDDARVREVAVDFHRAMREGLSPAQALRHAQLRMIRSGEPRMASPSSWAAVQLYGSE